MCAFWGRLCCRAELSGALTSRAESHVMPRTLLASFIIRNINTGSGDREQVGALRRPPVKSLLEWLCARMRVAEDVYSMGSRGATSNTRTGSSGFETAEAQLWRLCVRGRRVVRGPLRRRLGRGRSGDPRNRRRRAGTKPHRRRCRCRPRRGRSVPVERRMTRRFWRCE